MIETETALWSPPSAQSQAQDDGLSTLKGVPLFAELSNRELKRILRLMHQRTYQAGEVVFREGATGAGMYVVQKGAVDIRIPLPNGGDKVVATLRDAQFFGEMALLEAAPRSATCVAAERSELLGFFEPDLDNLIERDARLGSRVLRNLARLLAGRLRAMNENVKAAAT